MFNYFRKELDWGGRKLVLETGKIARQADGAVLISYGETIVLCTVVGVKSAKPGQDFFPLTVNYQEKAFAAGKIPGGFFKREGRPSEAEVLKSRLIDRPIRPLFPEGFRNEVQIVATVLSHDMENDPDIVAMIGCSAALTLSGIPFFGPVAAARVGYKDGQYILNPTEDETKTSILELVVAGTAEGVLMVESEAQELSEEVMLGAVNFGHQSFQPVIAAIIELAEHAAKEPWALREPSDEEKALRARVDDLARTGIVEAYKIADKQARHDAVDAAKAQATETLAAEGLSVEKAKSHFHDLESDVVRNAILDTGLRIDGRDTRTVRPIIAEVHILPRAHGSALFTRGETQAFCVATLGTGQDEQIIDALEGEYREHFMLHYNFPPYSVGEAGRMGSPGRREIGHGKLAWRAIHPLLPPKEQFPYTLRVVSEITESNGSSSMATVCGASLALMDAGVPLTAAVGGVAMGLVKEGDKYAILTDIAGAEDHYGDMDFKVAGTRNGITALQMDIKIMGITAQIMREALEQARKGRLFLLDTMDAVISKAAEEKSAYAPRIHTIMIPTDKIRDLIGPGGKVIRGIVDATGVKIDVEDTGKVNVASSDADGLARAIQMISDITAVPEVGKTYLGKVVRLAEFGAFVEIFPGTDGLLHVSEIAEHRVKEVKDELREGDQVLVKVLAIEGNRIKLSRKAVLREQREKLGLPPAPDPNSGGGGERERGPRPDRGPRGERSERVERPAPPAVQELEPLDDDEFDEEFEGDDDGVEEAEATEQPTEGVTVPAGDRPAGQRRGRRRRGRRPGGGGQAAPQGGGNN